MRKGRGVINSHQDVFEAVEQGLEEVPFEFIKGPLRSVAGTTYMKEYTYKGRSFEVNDELVRTKMLAVSTHPGGPTLSFRPKFEVLSCSNGMIAEEITKGAGQVLLAGTSFNLVAIHAKEQFLLFGDEMTKVFIEQAKASRGDLLKEVETVLVRMLEGHSAHQVLSNPRNPLTTPGMDLVMKHLKEQNRWGLAMALGEAAKEVFPTDVFQSLMLQRLSHGIIVRNPAQSIPIQTPQRH